MTEEARTIADLFARVGIDPRLDWIDAMPESAEDRARCLASWGIVANAVASQVAGLVATSPDQLAPLGIDPAWAADASEHPVAGRRAAPDEMLGVVGAAFVPQGREPVDAALDLGLDEAVHGFLGAGVEAVGGEHGRAVLAQWRAPYGRITWRLERADPHPTLGYGVRSRLTVALDQERFGASPALAQRLNALEGSVPQPLVGGGAWAVAVDEAPPALAHTAFFPNAGLRARLAPLLATQAWTRAGWLAGALAEAVERAEPS